MQYPQEPGSCKLPLFIARAKIFNLKERKVYNGGATYLNKKKNDAYDTKLGFKSDRLLKKKLLFSGEEMCFDNEKARY